MSVGAIAGEEENAAAGLGEVGEHFLPQVTEHATTDIAKDDGVVGEQLLVGCREVPERFADRRLLHPAVHDLDIAHGLQRLIHTLEIGPEPTNEENAGLGISLELDDIRLEILFHLGRGGKFVVGLEHFQVQVAPSLSSEVVLIENGLALALGVGAADGDLHDARQSANASNRDLARQGSKSQLWHRKRLRLSRPLVFRADHLGLDGHILERGARGRDDMFDLEPGRSFQSFEIRNDIGVPVAVSGVALGGDECDVGAPGLARRNGSVLIHPFEGIGGGVVV